MLGRVLVGSGLLGPFVEADRFERLHDQHFLVDRRCRWVIGGFAPKAKSLSEFDTAFGEPPPFGLGGKLAAEHGRASLAAELPEQLAGIVERVGAGAPQVHTRRFPVPTLSLRALSREIAERPAGQPIGFEIEEHVMTMREADQQRFDPNTAVTLDHVGDHRGAFPAGRVAREPERAHGIGFGWPEVGQIQTVPDGGQLRVQPFTQHATHWNLHGRHFHPRHDARRRSYPAVIPFSADPLAKPREIRTAGVQRRRRRLHAASRMATRAAEPVRRN